ncbi:MAG: hypothetical protein UIM53_06140 [Acutalibacteraceae bacterium]|nr:hypothetical protein [Acutalibacteraceae bacterium]
MWYREQITLKENKAVVKLRNNDGSFKQSCIIPSVMYPLNGKYQVFSSEICEVMKNEKVLRIFDSVKHSVGHCYTNTANLIKALKMEGIEAKSYVGWLFVSGTELPVHHCWAVVGNSVLDLSDDYTVMFSEENIKNFKDISPVEYKYVLASYREAAAKQPNSIRCAPVGVPSLPFFYVGCECEPDVGKNICVELLEKFPNHETVQNVGVDGLNKT